MKDIKGNQHLFPEETSAIAELIWKDLSKMV